jgi:hypothetical protein
VRLYEKASFNDDIPWEVGVNTYLWSAPHGRRVDPVTGRVATAGGDTVTASLALDVPFSASATAFSYSAVAFYGSATITEPDKGVSWRHLDAADQQAVMAVVERVMSASQSAGTAFGRVMAGVQKAAAAFSSIATLRRTGRALWKEAAESQREGSLSKRPASSRGGEWFSLSLGERVGVRASLHQAILFCPRHTLPHPGPLPKERGRKEALPIHAHPSPRWARVMTDVVAALDFSATAILSALTAPFSLRTAMTMEAAAVEGARMVAGRLLVVEPVGAGAFAEFAAVETHQHQLMN